jgi:hypothetical protein
VKCAGTNPTPTDVDIDGVIYSVKMADCIYRVSTNNHSEVTGALIDRGANGGIAGNDCRVIEVNDQPHRYVNVEGIDGHVMERCRLVTAGAVTHSNRGPVILIMHQYAHSGKGHSIHSSPQLEWNGVDVDDKSARVGSVVNSDLSLLTVSAFPSISDVAFHTSTCAHTLIKSGRSYHMSS